jgi:hypothetical protein
MKRTLIAVLVITGVSILAFAVATNLIPDWTWNALNNVRNAAAGLHKKRISKIGASFSQALTTPPVSPLSLPLDRRLDLPQCVVSTSLRLTDFVSFIATTFKVPLLAEVPPTLSELKTPAGIYSARQLLDIATSQLAGFEWTNEGGVAHIYDKRLLESSGNLLNVRIPRFVFPRTVGEFTYYFRPCISCVIQGYGCGEGIFTGFEAPKLKQGGLPQGQTFTNEVARKVLLTALQVNGRFYVLIAFENRLPKLQSQYPFTN